MHRVGEQLVSGTCWGRARRERGHTGLAVGFGGGHGPGNRSLVQPWSRALREVSPT